jgi:hypothetical protein
MIVCRTSHATRIFHFHFHFLQIPEITKSESSSSPRTRLVHLLLHVLGLGSGVAIMASIALYEDSIQRLATSGGIS